MQNKFHGDPVVLFASKPDLVSMCTISVCIEQGPEFSTTQPRILRCRELIFTEPDIIAAPSSDLFDCFNVVMPQSLFKTGRVQTWMRNNNLQFSKPFRVNPGLLQACLRYTLLARLSPAWNKVGDWLIQGRDFLVHNGGANAVKCDIVANSDELYISVSATVLRLANLQLRDLNLSALEMQSLLYNAQHGEGQLALQNVSCHVVPSMKKARLCSISLCIPEDSPFNSYRELKRHWKNTYGFRLPDTDEDIFYAQVSFWGLGGKQFTYPSVCIRSEPLQYVPRVDAKPILSLFLQDLHNKISSACGQPLRFQPQIRHTVSALYPASQEVKGPGPNLSKRSNTEGKHVPLRNPKDVVALTNRTSQRSAHLSQVTAFKSSALRHADTSRSTNASVISQESCKTPQPYSTRSLVRADVEHITGNSSFPASQVFSQPHIQFSQDRTKVSSPYTRHTAYKPQLPDEQRKWSSSQTFPGTSQFLSHSQRQFREDHTESPFLQPLPSASQADSKSQVTTPQVENRLGPGTQARFVPVFKPKVSSGSSKKRPTSKDEAPETNHFQISEIGSSKIIPTFKPKLTKCSKLNPPVQLPERSQSTPSVNSSKNRSIGVVSCPLVTSSTGDDSSNTMSRPISTDYFTTPSPRQAPAFQARKPNFSIKSPKVKHSTSQPTPNKISLAGKLKQKMAASAGVKEASTNPSANLRLGQQSVTWRPMTSSVDDDDFEVPAGSRVFGGSNTLLLSTPGTSQGKRKTDFQGAKGDGIEKKPRSKPQVQDIDVEQLARSDQLTKVNTVTLISWLKERGITCKAKDKKSDLVQRVKVFLALTSTEP